MTATTSLFSVDAPSGLGRRGGFGRIGAWTKLVGLVAFVATAALTSGCNRASCAGLHAPTAAKKAPKIVEVRTLSQDVIDPWAIVVELLFLAPNGDASDGNLSMFIGSNTPVTLPLKQYFGTSEVALDATSGRLAIPLHLSSSAVQDDTVLRLGMQLQDGSNMYSNCYTLDLHFAIDKLGATLGKSVWRRC